jgi:hypothetical protein
MSFLKNMNNIKPCYGAGVLRLSRMRCVVNIFLNFENSNFRLRCFDRAGPVELRKHERQLSMRR